MENQEELEEQIMKDMLKEHWQVSDPQLHVLKRDYNTVYKVDGMYILKARLLNEQSAEKVAEMDSDEKRLMKYVNFLRDQGLGVAYYVGPGVVTGDKMQLIVTKAVQGKLIHALHNYKCEATVKAAAQWLAKYTEASKKFTKEFPEEAEKFVKWDVIDDGFQVKAFTQKPEIPKDAENFGLIHSDLHPGNFHVTEENKMHVFDWDRVQWSWYLVDLGTFLFQGLWYLYKDQKDVPKEQIIIEQQQLVDWAILGYSGSLNGVNREHLRQCTITRRDFTKYWAKEDNPYFIPFFKDIREGKLEFKEAFRV